MPTPQEYFAPWESQTPTITGWASMLDQINRVVDFVGTERKLAWRGLSDATYKVYSTLHRRLVDGGRRLVTEDDLVDFESRMLAVARSRWRFDDLSALEILAQFQHFGAPTRLLDVTFNPLIALWFAVEPKYEYGKLLPDIDGRLIAYDISGQQIALDDEWGARDLPWRSASDGWTNQLPRVWRPPSYNPRIPAQDSAFLLGGIPTSGNRWARKAPGDSTTNKLWKLDEVRSVTSVTMRMYSLDHKHPYPTSKPTLTIRVPAAAKPSIRKVLDHNFGINTSSVYPDMYGLAQRGWLDLAP